MGIIRSVSGMLTVQIVSADIPALLAAVTDRGVLVLRVKTMDELTVQLQIRRQDWRLFSELCRRRGEEPKILQRGGVYWRLRSMLRRPLLLAGVCFLVVMTLILPGRVLFTSVEGNVNIPTAKILEAAAESGICFGASRREVRSERMKNALLEAVPELQWAGVNTYGCLAVISVRERETEAAERREDSGVSSVVAACDGVVLSVTATRGSCLCQPGQAVTKDQVLISGYTDLGLVIRGEAAQGEIFAQTRHDIQVVTPLEAFQRRPQGRESVKISFVLGKKRINLWKGSGICEGSCGRMYEEYYITLPGGFQLPVALVKETVLDAELGSAVLGSEDTAQRLETFGESYLREQMISGRIVSGESEIFEENGLLVLKGEYLCTEMIGRRRQEKIGE